MFTRAKQWKTTIPWRNSRGIPFGHASRPEGFQGGTKEAFRDLLALQALKVFCGIMTYLLGSIIVYMWYMYMDILYIYIICICMYIYIYTYIIYIYILYDIWGGNRDDENPIIPAALPGTSVGNLYKKSCQSQVIGDSQWPQITLWLCQNSYWKWPFIVDFPIENGGSFHSFLYVDQRVPEGTSYSWNRVAAIPWFHVMLKFRRWVKRWLTGDENTAYFVSIQIFIYQQPFVSCIYIYIYHGCIFTYRHITLHIQIYRHWIMYIIIIYIYNYLYIYI